MMNKLKYFFLFALCAGLIGGAAVSNAAAQMGGDRVLVAGKKPLKQSDINKSIEFFEWAFETTFTDKEREQYQAYIERDYRKNPAKTRAETDTIINVFSKIMASGADVQQATRESFVPGFVADLRKTESDEDSRFMLGIYERAKGGNDDSAAASGNNSRGGKKSSGGASGGGGGSLIGRWTRSDGAGGAGDGTGKTLYNSGADTTFEFFADGTMLFLVEKETLSIMQCRISEVTRIPGTYTVSGGEVTMNLAAGSVVGKSSCEAKGNFKKSLTADSLTKTFIVKNLDSVFRPDAPLILCLDGAKDDACFERAVK